MKLILVALLLTGCARNPGPFEGRVGYQYRTETGLRTSISSDYGFFDVYSVDQSSQVWKGDKVLAECKYMRGIFGGPYECKILKVLDETRNTQ